MRPDEDPIGARGGEADQLQRIEHVVENAAIEDQIVARSRRLEMPTDIAEQEGRSVQPRDVLDDQRLQERFRI